ncbi:MAG: DMT family transporter [Flavobacteriaceae bacterium]|tara:strand:+ start:918 stop:1811 length:894 start_codon:yes stop_codon:yes gene_type:complete
MPSDKLKSTLHFHFIVFIFGFTAILGKLISIDAVSLVWYRMVLATAVVALFMAVRRISFALSTKQLYIMLICGVLIALHWVFFFHAVKVSNVSVTLSIMSSGALITALVEPIFYKRTFVWYEIVLGLIVVVALGLIMQTEYHYIEGMMFAFIAILLSVAFTLINGKAIHKSDARVMSVYQLGAGAVCMSIILLMQGKFTVELFSISKTDILWISILVIVCTAYAFVVSIAVMRHLTPFSLMLAINMEPVYGILFGILIFGSDEKMSFAFYIGTLLILLSVLTNGFLKLKKKMSSSTN